MKKNKKVLIAPDSYKESLSALEVSQAIEEGFRQIFPDWTYEKVPMADGGEGTTQSLVDATKGTIKKANVSGPLGDEIESFYGLSGDGNTAIIELAAASGLELIEESERKPMEASTWGLGGLIRSALDDGVEKIILGLGGSATTDGGAGMIQSLGGQLLDENKEQIPPGGEGLKDLATIDLAQIDTRLENVTIEVASDVTNPLTGKQGAAYVYGPQKGANAEQVEELDKNLKHFSDIIKRDLGKDVEDIAGSGAAGGTGAGLLAFLDADLRKGSHLIIDMLNLEEKIATADLVITGEGSINDQTVYNKAPIAVAKIAKKYELPTIAIAGSLLDGYEKVYDEGLDAVFSVLPQISDLNTALENAYPNIVNTARNVASLLSIKENI